MKSPIRSCLLFVTLLTVSTVLSGEAKGQAFGVALQANLMPAAGGMGGVGIARPQDVQSSLALNPATLTQHKGTKFSFSGAWVEPTINMDTDDVPLAGVTAFESRSRRPGSIVGNIGVTQDLTSKGLPVTAGIGLLTASGLGVNYRDVNASNGTSAELVVLGTAAGMGAKLTDRLSVGFTGVVATSTLDGVFTGISAATPDYNMRGMLGVTYQLDEATSVGGFWHTKQKHTFDDFVRLPLSPSFEDVGLSFPNVYGIGVANSTLADGRLLVAIDFSYLEWSETDFFGNFWDDQFTVQTGVQYTNCNGCKFRLGYVYAQNASRRVVAPDIGGIITPQAAVDYISALFPNANEHRITGGVGMEVLPGVQVDLFAGGMFEDTQDFGDSSVSVESYWVGFGTTWLFGRGACGRDRVCDQW